ncbi:4-hydroxy-3-methylbut-2-enyl diphosphate reductase [Marinicella sp. S1101]|uniref:4-hydroxy-3-methylbut-2-enyl diphosphate reductase n=1 Tax=Marinicella marina TaxID=2996016 RepID=UPI002260FD06|nr:4-hydroxy-3-methylbut-2-enyl diphosphate reductase [Marinicella marina]MCX7554641.1 4-hydroxy-3-methylbut-2-enyl diphosphate reductase [Marinicella marina]MDJ1140706.1 4-hydroxy-3-methylbut-2-enyl diphosphate reductase [Marinicella marina]
MKILLANPRGFCAGVDRAIDIVNRALDSFGAPIYVRHEVVHNQYVVDKLRDRGAVFVDELEEVPDDQIVIFSAHGVSKAVRKEAADRKLKVFDATCPLVTKVHIEVFRYCKQGFDLILIGHHGHPEVEGTLGQWDQLKGTGSIYLVDSVAEANAIEVNQPEKIAYVTQTTLSMDDTRDIINELRQRFPKVEGPKHDDICYATQNRQVAVRHLAEQADLVLVVGSVNSSNSNRLKELAERQGVPSYLIDGAADLQQNWFEGVSTIGLTAGASAPEKLVRDVIDAVQAISPDLVVQELEGEPENMVFALPKELRLVQK